MIWSGKISGWYSASIDLSLRSGNLLPMNDEVKHLGVPLYERYPMLIDSIVDGFIEEVLQDVHDNNCHLVSREMINFLIDYIKDASEWEKREFLKFVSGGRLSQLDLFHNKNSYVCL